MHSWQARWAFSYPSQSIKNRIPDSLEGKDLSCRDSAGQGIFFAEFDGHVIEYELKPGQQIVVDTGHLAAMTASCQMEIQTVPGMKNKFLGGEGLFNTVITGPGHVWLQTMPLSNVAGVLRAYLPTSN